MATVVRTMACLVTPNWRASAVQEDDYEEIEGVEGPAKEPCQQSVVLRRFCAEEEDRASGKQKREDWRVWVHGTATMPQFQWKMNDVRPSRLRSALRFLRGFCLWFPGGRRPR